MPHGASGIPYNEHYEQLFDSSHGRGYAGSAPLQQPQQPNLFVPSQAPQVCVASAIKNGRLWPTIDLFQ